MYDWDKLDSAIGRDGQEISLHVCEGEFSFQVDETVLMNSASHHSEDQLARIGCANSASRAGQRVLVGGLGMGFTLRAALDYVRPDCQVEVAELFPEVVTWNRGPLAYLAGSPLSDPRVTVRVGDIIELLDASVAAYDSILLDVDNGPSAFTAPSNDNLYDEKGVARLARALRPRGVVAVWSSCDDGDFTFRLRKGGFHCRKIRVRARENEGPAHQVWLATLI